MAANAATVAEPASIDRVYHVVAVFVIVTSLVGLVAALAGVFHAAQVLLLSLLLTGVLAWKTRLRDALRGTVGPRWSHVLLLIVVTLFFRLPAYNYVLGGQDQGLYTNIAQHIERTGGIKVRDTVAQHLSGSTYLKTYLKQNRFSNVWGNPYLLGVYSNPHDATRLEFQFYHLFPVWMALFAGLFGSTFAVYALTFFALLSILFFYRLTLILTDSHTAGLFAGLLLALSPLHAFFSKFPVTEVPALAFTLIGFTFVAAYWSCPETSMARRRWLLLSVFAFLCMFVTRMSGFTYIPFFVAIGMAVLACDRSLGRRRDIQLWSAGVVAAFLLSAWYGFRWDHQTVIFNYGAWFRPLLGAHWLRVTIGLVVVGLAAWAAVTWWISRADTRREWLAARVVAPFRVAIGPMMLALLAAGGWYVYRLAWTRRYIGTALDSSYHLADAGWGGAIATSLPQLAVFLGPLLVIAFLIAMCRRWPDPRLEAVRLFLLVFFAYAMLLRWVLPYNPYYARFLLSELAPYLILFVVCVWAVLIKGTVTRTVLTGCFVLSLGYAGIVSAAQVGRVEEAGLHDTLARLVAPVGHDDLIMLDLHDAGVLKTALIYTFGRHVVTVNQDDLDDAGYVAALASGYDTTWLVTPKPTAPETFALFDKVRYRVVTYRHDHFAPLSLTTGPDQPLSLYRLVAPRVPLDASHPLGSDSLWVSWLARGWSSPEQWGVWSNARTSKLRIDPRSLPPLHGKLILRLQGRVFVEPRHPCQRVLIEMNGAHAASYRPCFPKSHFQMDLPIPESLISRREMIVVTFVLPDTKSPKALGISSDSRQLGIGLSSFEMSPYADK